MANNWAYFEQKYGAPIGQGAQCRVYRRDGTVYKVLSDGHDLYAALREGYALSVAQTLPDVDVSRIHGVYQEGGHIVLEMDYVSGEQLIDPMLAALRAGDRAALDALMDRMTAIQLAIHSKETTGLADARSSYVHYVRHAEHVPEALRQSLLADARALPDGDALCHNDFHARNVLLDGGRYVVIDWDSAMIGDPAGDVAHSYLATLLTHEIMADAYLDSYLRQSGMERARVERWLPIHAFILWVALRGSDPERGERMRAFFDRL